MSVFEVGRFINRKYEKHPHMHRWPAEKTLPIAFGLKELELQQEPDNITENVSDERGRYEEINNRGIYGFYRESVCLTEYRQGKVIQPAHTLSEIGQVILRCD
jgi:translation elongation factor EF-1beta